MRKYSLRERFDTKGNYHIILDQDGYDRPILHWYAGCKAKKTKKVDALRAEGKRRREQLIESDKPKYQYREVK